MSGNVAEWEDDCTGTECVVRGGSYMTTAQNELRCDDRNLEGRSDTTPDIGFRCCSP
jgi:formylglycine-generating enzyme required for sulfatase activity